MVCGVHQPVILLISRRLPAPSPSQRGRVGSSALAIPLTLRFSAHDVEEVVGEERLAFPNSPAW
jgi:hypothetical protein